MIHIGKETDFEELRHYLDSLKSQGFVTYCEGIIHTDKNSDTLSIPLVKDLASIYGCYDNVERLDTLERKMRRLMGQYSFYSREIIASKQHFVAQNDSLLNLGGDRDYWVDLTLADTIQEFEERYGEISLSSYDFECPIDSYDYKGKGDERLSSLRSGKSRCNDKLAKWVIHSDFDKIVVVYGAAHTNYLMYHVLPYYGYSCKELNLKVSPQYLIKE